MKDRNDTTKVFPATVVKVLSDSRVVINRGHEHQLKPNQRFILYRLSSEEIIDPETGESLGYLEEFKGIGKIIHIQDKMTIIESSEKETYQATERTSIIQKQFGFPNSTIVKTVIAPFDNPQEGDLVKPI
ncbi:hypothetical protein POG22_22005 [Geitlerinema sp. CS-897]|nr:hypothetical protein [Geitlerinema sp. CS-897]